uniref:Mineralization related protein 1 n=1 Tax=Pinctada imbricata TaxID=66713 RepID=A0A0F6QP70_PINIB|nr:mineralization related protein 1 [Pinctada imbricata]
MVITLRIIWILLLSVVVVSGLSRRFHPGEVYKRQEHEPGRSEPRVASYAGTGEQQRPFLSRKTPGAYGFSQRSKSVVLKANNRNYYQRNKPPNVGIYTTGTASANRQNGPWTGQHMRYYENGRRATNHNYNRGTNGNHSPQNRKGQAGMWNKNAFNQHGNQNQRNIISDSNTHYFNRFQNQASHNTWQGRSRITQHWQQNPRYHHSNPPPTGQRRNFRGHQHYLWSNRGRPSSHNHVKPVTHYHRTNVREPNRYWKKERDVLHDVFSDILDLD